MEHNLFRNLDDILAPVLEEDRNLLELRRIANSSIALQIGFIIYSFAESYPTMNVFIIGFGHIGISLVEWFKQHKICNQLHISVISPPSETPFDVPQSGEISSLTISESLTGIQEANFIIMCTGHHNIYQFSNELIQKPPRDAIVLSTVIGLPVEKLKSMFQVDDVICIRADPFLLQDCLNDSNIIPPIVRNGSNGVLNWLSVKCLESSMSSILCMLKARYEKSTTNINQIVTSALAPSHRSERRRSGLVMSSSNMKEMISRKIRLRVFGVDEGQASDQDEWVLEFQKSLAYIVCVVQMP